MIESISWLIFGISVLIALTYLLRLWIKVGREIAPTSDLLEINEIYDACICLKTGEISRMYRVHGTNLSITSQEESDRISKLYMRIFNQMGDGTRIQVLACNRAMLAHRWVPNYLSQFPKNPLFQKWVDIIGRWLYQEFTGRHISDLSTYIVVTVPGPVNKSYLDALNPKAHKERKVLQSELDKSIKILDIACNKVIREFVAIGLTVTAEKRQGVIDFLWDIINPYYSQNIRVKPPKDIPSDIRTLRAKIAQSTITICKNEIEIDKGYERTIALREWPEELQLGWLWQLLISGVNFRLSMHVSPIPKKDQRKIIDPIFQKLSKYDRDDEEEDTFREVGELRKELRSGSSRLFRGSILITIRARTRAKLDEDTGIVADALGDVAANYIEQLQRWQLPSWQSTLPIGLDRSRVSFYTSTAPLATMYPYFTYAAGTTGPGGAFMGTSEPGNQPIMLDLTDPRLPRQAMVVTGSSGEGKTVSLANLALFGILTGSVRVLVAESSEGHWNGLVSAVGGVVHQVGLTEQSNFRINPFDLPPGKTMPDRDKMRFLLMFLALIGTRHGILHDLSDSEENMAERLIRELYRAHDGDTFYLSDLYKRLHLERDASRRAGHGSTVRTATSLIERLERFVGEGRHAQFVDGHTTISPTSCLEVFNLRHVHRDDLHLVMLPLIEYIESQIADQTKQTFFITDESWKLLQNPIAADFMERMARGGRHQSLRLMISSQQDGDFDNVVGQVIAKNSPLKMSFRNARGDYAASQALFGLTPEATEEIDQLETRKGRYAMFYLHARKGANSGRGKFSLPPELYWLFTSHPPELKMKEELMKQMNGDIYRVVTALSQMNPEQRLQAFRHVLDEKDLEQLVASSA